jgi:hypothetical protein
VAEEHDVATPAGKAGKQEATMTMTQQPTGKTRRSPENIWIGTGAVRQHDGKLPLYICNTCGSDVVWATAKATGRAYLVNVHGSYNGARYYVASSLHDCAPALKRRAEYRERDEEIARKPERDAHYAYLFMLMDEHDEKGHASPEPMCHFCERAAAKAAKAGQA